MRFTDLSVASSDWALVAHNRRAIEAEREQLLERQRRENKYHQFVRGRLILKQGILDKRRVRHTGTLIVLVQFNPYAFAFAFTFTRALPAAELAAGSSEYSKYLKATFNFALLRLQ